eukprot:7330791-Pyramimonas_sp.AAC.1
MPRPPCDFWGARNDAMSWVCRLRWRGQRRLCTLQDSELQDRPSRMSNPKARHGHRGIGAGVD